MIESLRAIAAIPELRNRVLFTLGMLAVFRLGSHIPTPGVNTEALRVFAEQAKDTMFGFYDMFSGGNLSNATIFARTSSGCRRKASWAGARSPSTPATAPSR
jgi:preprotein translocase subunit SecY